MAPIPQPPTQPAAPQIPAQNAAPAAAPSATSPQAGHAAGQLPRAMTVQEQMPPPRPPALQWWEVQGVLPSIAAVVAVVGTALSLHINTTRNLKAARLTTAQQLRNSRLEAQRGRKHAAEQAQQDRLGDARRTIYGELIDDYRKVQEAIGGLAQLELGDLPEVSKPLVAMSASVTKLWIWSEVETAYEVREFYSQVNEMFFEALAKFHPILQKRNLIRQLENDAGAARAKHEKARQQLHEIRLPAGGLRFGESAALEHRLSAEAERYFQQASDLQREVHKMKAEIAEPAASYDDFVIDEQAKLMIQINKVMSAARSELGLKGDTTKLELQSHDMSVRAAWAVANLKAAVKRS